MFKKLIGLLALVPIFGLSCLNALDSAASVHTDALNVTGWNVTLHASGGDFSVRRVDSSTPVELLNGSQYSFSDINLSTDWTVDISVASGAAWSAYVETPYGVYHWHSKPSVLDLPWYEGDIDVYLYNGYDDVYDWGYSPSDGWITVKASLDHVDDVMVGAVAESNYEAGYSDGSAMGYENGYDAGIRYGRNTFPDVNQGVYFQWDTNYNSSNTYTVSWSKSTGVASSAVVSYGTPTQYFERQVGETVSFSIVCNQGGGNIPFFVGYTTVVNHDMQILDSSLAVNGVYHLPWWEGSMTFLIIPNTTDSSLNSYDLSLAYNSDVANIRVLSSYSQGYQNGYAAGSSAGYSSGYDVGWKAGDARYQEGYDTGYDVGYRMGFIRASQEGSGRPQVVDIWPLISAIVTMPFTFMTQGLDWTLFEGSPYEFGVSTFIGTVFVVLMVWKIFKLVIGMGK